MILSVALACGGSVRGPAEPGSSHITYDAQSPTAGAVHSELTNVTCSWGNLEGVPGQAKHKLQVMGIGTDALGRSSVDAFAQFAFDEDAPTSRVFLFPSFEYPFNAWFTLRLDLSCVASAPKKVDATPRCELHVDDLADGHIKGRIDCTSLPEQANPFVEETTALVSVQARFDCPVTHE